MEGMEALIWDMVSNGKLSFRDAICEVATPMGMNGSVVWVKMGLWDVVWTNDYVMVF